LTNLQNMTSPLYFDYAASTPIDSRVKKVYLEALDKYYANSSAIYSLGQKSRQALELSRRQIGSILNCQPTELVFTSSATESNNLVIQGLILDLDRYGANPKHVICSGLEHASVQKILENSRLNVNYTKIESNIAGIISLPDILTAIRDDTVLISLMLVNNELGTIQPVADLAQELEKINAKRALLGQPKIYLHTDAAQAIQFVNIDTKKLGVDLITISGQKIYAPKGTAILYVKQGTPLAPLLHGGGQEHGLRSGTQNVAGVVALAEALRICREEQESEKTRLTKFRDELISRVMEIDPRIEINGFNPLNLKDLDFWKNCDWLAETRKFFADGRIANNVNLLWPGINQQELLTYLDLKRVCVSSGSSCASGSSQISLVALSVSGLAGEAKNMSVTRVTTGKFTIQSELNQLVQILQQAATDLS
jgi:cysteine desulfurase